MSRLIISFLALILTLTSNTNAEEYFEWTPLGLGGGGGQFAPAISPHNPDLMFVACDMSGFYRSSDGGESWTMYNFRNIKSSTRLNPVFHPTNPEIIWNDTYESWSNYILISTDAGLTWDAVWDTPSTPIDMICLESEPLNLLVALKNGEVWNSADGENFSKAFTVESGDNIVAIDATNSEIWIFCQSCAYLSTDRGVNFERKEIPSFNGDNSFIDGSASGETVAVLNSANLLISTDGGENWNESIEHIDFDRGEFKFVEVCGDTIWVTTAGGGKYQSTALLSTDGGENFEPVFFCNDSWDDESNLENGWLDIEFNCGWGGPAIGFDACNSNSSIALWTDYGRTLLTTDAGESWRSIYTRFADEGSREKGKRWESTGLDVTTSWDIYFNPENTIIQAAYTDIGGAYSEDGGATWRSTYGNGIPSQWFNTTYEFEYNENTGQLFGAFSGRHDIIGGWGHNYWNLEGAGGIAVSNDDGKNWTPLSENGLPSRPHTSVALKSDGGNNTTLFAAAWSHGVFRSTDGGANWERKSDGLEIGDGSNSPDGPNTHVVQVEAHPDGTIFALKTKYIRENSEIKNDGGLYKSTDDGETWELISEDVPHCEPHPTIDPDGARSWCDPISFTLDLKDSGHIWVNAQNCNNGKIQGGLYETTDGGENWERILQIYGAYRLTLSKYRPGRMYLATRGAGVMIKRGTDAEWKEIESFPFATATRITEDPQDSSVVWVNTYGGGVWKGVIKDDGVGVAEKETNDDKLKIYPNPFQNELNILAENAESIQIFDIFGGKVAQFGSGAVKWNAGNNAGGVYIIKAIYKDKILVKKALLTK